MVRIWCLFSRVASFAMQLLFLWWLRCSAMHLYCVCLPLLRMTMTAGWLRCLAMPCAVLPLLWSDLYCVRDDGRVVTLFGDAPSPLSKDGDDGKLLIFVCKDELLFLKMNFFFFPSNSSSESFVLL